MDIVVIGCGNVLRGDDAAGPELVARLVERGPPSGVRCIDCGTAGVDAVRLMRGADEAVFVDACRTGRPPGAIVELTDEQLGRFTSPGGIDVHSFRWDHALALGRLLLGARFPARVGAWLVEGRAFEPGAALSPEVDRALDALAGRLLDAFRHRQREEAGAAGSSMREAR